LPIADLNATKHKNIVVVVVVVVVDVDVDVVVLAKLQSHSIHQKKFLRNGFKECPRESSLNFHMLDCNWRDTQHHDLKGQLCCNIGKKSQKMKYKLV
jgi:hypothetical protein